MIGEMLRDWRKRWQEQRGKRIEDAAVGLRVGVSTIYAYERDAIDIDPRDIRAFGTFYGVSEAEICWALHQRSLPKVAA